MAIYAIGDLHLGKMVDKPMNKFGSHWDAHEMRIKESWLQQVKDEDLVLIPGDISWAMYLEDAKVDLGFIDALPGHKMFVRGNHDYWWKSITKLNKMSPTMNFIQNNSFMYDDIVVCGTRGWLCPNEYQFTEEDEKIYTHEINRLELSLKHSMQYGEDKFRLVMLHYPPTNDQHHASGFTQLLEQYNVNLVVYGHLHGQASFNQGLQGTYNGVEYMLTSADYLDFKLKQIII